MSTTAETVTGTVGFGPWSTWYRISGDPLAGTPLVVVHGGPGSTHDYLTGLTRLGGARRAVVLYDQLGNGGSSRLPGRDPGFWTPELFVEELENLLAELGIAEDYLLLGQSWGGVLAAAHAAGRPAGLRGLVVCDAPASYPLWIEELAALRAELPPDVREVLRVHEAAGTTADEAYRAAEAVFYRRHVCRTDPVPPELTASYLEIATDPTVYGAMNGPNEFHITGTLREFSLLDRLPRIAVPTLVLTGRHDEVTPRAAAPYVDLVPGARGAVVEDASHLPHLENPDGFDAVVAPFLDAVGGS